MTPNTFDDRVSEALAGRAEGRVELTTNSLDLSVDELAKADPDFWRRLGEEQRAHLLRHISASAANPNVVAPSPSPTVPKAFFRPPKAAGLRPWHRMHRAPLPLRGLMAGVTMGTLFVVVAMAVIGVFEGAYGWPSEARSAENGFCPRLSPTVDRCIYRVQNVLTWADAAARAGMSEVKLRKDNPGLRGYSLWPDDRLFILH